MSHEQQEPFLYATGTQNPFEASPPAAKAGGTVSDRMGHHGVDYRSDRLPGVIGADTTEPQPAATEHDVTNQTASGPGVIGSQEWREADNSRWTPAVREDPEQAWMHDNKG